LVSRANTAPLGTTAKEAMPPSVVCCQVLGRPVPEHHSKPFLPSTNTRPLGATAKDAIPPTNTRPLSVLIGNGAIALGVVSCQVLGNPVSEHHSVPFLPRTNTRPPGVTSNDAIPPVVVSL
jgi:hypothetical protein